MFIELRAKSNLSFLEGASDSREYIRQAKILNMPAIGIADSNGVYGLPRTLEAIRNDCPGVRLISGADVRIKDHPRVSFHAKSLRGWTLLCRIITAVHAGKEKGGGFVTIEELVALVDRYGGGEDLFCIADVNHPTQFETLDSLFPGNLYLALCRYGDFLDRVRTKRVLDAARKYSLPIVATNDVHYHIPERQPLQDAVTSIRTGKSLDDLDRDGFGNGERYLKSDRQMRALFHDLPEAIENTQKIADGCRFELTDIKYSYPNKFVPQALTSKQYLEQLVLDGSCKRYGHLLSREVATQIRKELDFVFERNLEAFFLSNYDICNFARAKNIMHNARGSAVNSVLCYCLFISSVDPIKAGLYFPRFLNSARNEPPDIDIDFEHHRREEVIQWIYKRYGRNHAAMVAAIQTYREDGATVELSKALGAEIGTISAHELKKHLVKLYGLKAYRIKLLPKLTEEIHDSPRHLSTHPGGFLLSDGEIPDFVPIEPARMEGRTIIQWDKNDIETLGLMKVDILSIGFLSVLQIACGLAKINPQDIPYDCPKTFAMIGRGETHGCFQIESRAQINTNQRTRPQKFYDLVIGVSIVRPLASIGGMVVGYLKGLKNKFQGIKFEVGNETIEQILGKTCGIPLFPEQMMQIATEVAGFTDIEVEQLRKTLGKYRSAESVDSMARKLHDRLIQKGIKKDFADLLLTYVQGYSNYGFPESHAVSYADVAYKSAWLKCHYPAALLVGLLNSQPMGFYKIDTLIYEAQRNGVRILPIHPNFSAWDAILESPMTLRMGFCNVRGMSEDSVREMIAARDKKPFGSVEDFIARTNFNSDTLENLALGNVFACWQLDRRHTFWQTLEFERLIKRNTTKIGQYFLFDETAANAPVKNIFSEMSIISEQLLDYLILGYSPEGNPMKGLREVMPELPKLTSTRFKILPDKAHIHYAGIMTVLQRPPPAKGTAFMTLEDEFGSIDVIFQNDVYEKYREEISRSRFMTVYGKVQLRTVTTPQGFFEMRTLTAISGKAFGQAAHSKPVRPQQNPRAIGRLLSEYAFEAGE